MNVDRTVSPLSTSSTETSGLVSGHALRGLHREAVVAGILLSELANKVNRKARFSVFECGDVVTIAAENRAASNMARAYAGLIHARVAQSIEFGAPTVAIGAPVARQTRDIVG